MVHPGGRPPGHCTICKHAERVRAELAMAKGKQRTAVARRFQMSPHALSRHWANHVSDERLASLITETHRQEFVAGVVHENDSALDHHRGVRCGLEQRFYAVLRAGNDDLSLVRLAHELTSVNDSIARIAGELAASPLVQIQNNQVSIAMLLERPEVARFWAEIVEAVHDLPNFHEIRERLTLVCNRHERAESVVHGLPRMEHDSADETAEASA